MKKLLIVPAILFLTRPAHAGAAAVGSLIFSVDTKQVAVSTNCASPTQIMTRDSFISHSFVVNNSTWTNLLISSTSAAIIVGSAFYVPSSTAFSPDGPQDAFNGPMWACSTPTVSGIQAGVVANVGVFRSK